MGPVPGNVLEMSVSIRGLLAKRSTATSQSISTMSLSSKPKKVKPKGTVRELKLVHSVNRRGAHTIKTEEVKTPKQGGPSSTGQHSCSSSPIKRLKLDASDNGPIPFVLEGPDMPTKRQTLVFLLPSYSKQCLIIVRAKMTT